MNKNIDVIIEDVDILVSGDSSIIDNTYKKINIGLITMYWNIGKLVNDYRKEHNYKYGNNVILKFLEKLSKKYRREFNRKNINRMYTFNRKFEIKSAQMQSVKSNRNNDKFVIGTVTIQSIYGTVRNK